MALQPNLSKGLTITWITEKAFRGRCRVSSDFSLGETTWYLKMDYVVNLYNDSKRYYSICLFGRGIRNPKEPFTVITGVGMNSGKGNPFRDSCELATVKTDIQSLWICCMDEITSKISDFKDYSEMMVVCVFKDLPPSMCRIRNERIEVMTQTDFDRRLSVKNIHDVKLSSHGCEQDSSSLLPNLDSLSNDLGKLLEDKVIPDINLRCGDRTIAAHKAILAARSQVFSAMFQSRMLETETGVVDIADVDVQVLEMFLKYLYSGKLSDVPDDLLPSLYAAADKYAVSPLEAACSERMISNLTRENCLNVLLLASAHSDQDLKNAIFNFILNEMEVLKSQEWTKFSKENLAISNEVLQFVFQKKLF